MDWNRLGELLKASGVLDERQWRGALVEHERFGGSIARVLLDRRLVEEATLVQALSQLFGVQWVDLREREVTRAVIDLVPAAIAEQYELVPFHRDSQFLHVAMVDPARADGIDAVRARAQLNVRVYVTGPRMFEHALARFYGKVVVSGYAVDPRVTSGSFLKHDVVDLGRAGAAPKVAAAGDERVAALEQLVHEHLEPRIAMLESLLARDEDVIRRLCGLLVDKRVTTRDELVELMR
jgi:hypothetical protein